MRPGGMARQGSNKAVGEGGQKKSTLGEIQRLQKERDERRQAMELAKVARAQEEQRNKDSGTPGDIDFQRMIVRYREQNNVEQPHRSPGESKICICVRKRPISSKEVKRYDYDSVTCLNPVVVVHNCKLKVDGISKYLDNNSFEFDHTFGEEDDTAMLYEYSVQTLVPFVLSGGRATVFAYGQTGSGKTFTMQGIQQFVADDLFALLERYEEQNQTNVQVQVSYFEIYGGRCQDLLNSRQRLNVREDGGGEVIVSELLELQAASVDELHAIIDSGNRNRTTHATESNDESSRSHAICQIALYTSSGSLIGRFSLIDLAGSERGADTKHHNRQRRMEGAEINKSLLALKECIRALDTNSSHVPYRGSKLTLVLKDSFTSKKSRTVMIANVSPAASSADHTINTLRYADRIKERTVGGQAARNAKDAANGVSPPPAAAAGGAARRPSVGDAGDAHKAGAAPVSSRDSRNKQVQQTLAENISQSAPSPPRGKGRSVFSSNDRSNSSSSSKDNNNDITTPPPAEARGDRGSSSSANSRGAKEGPPTQPPLRSAAAAKGGSSSAAAAAAADYKQQQPVRNRSDSGYDDDFNEADIDRDSVDTEDVDAFHRTVQDLFEEEEELLNLHMSIIQENAELLTEEGRLLQQIQGENNDIDAYAARLDSILAHKQQLIVVLREKLEHFRAGLAKEERESRRAAGHMHQY